MNRLRNEYRLFQSCPRNMRILLGTNLIYALTIPVVDIFVAAYVMRNSQDPKLVVTYQLAVYTGIPLSFLINGFLLRFVRIKRLYSAGMLLGGLAMVAMMSLGKLSLGGTGITGVFMGLSFGLFWANRDLLALSCTTDAVRNYYYGLETFFFAIGFVVVPAIVGGFIETASGYGWFGGDRMASYQIVAGAVLMLTVVASIMVHQGDYPNPPRTRFIFSQFHSLWKRMQLLAVLKGLVHGYISTAPAMLILRFVGQEGTLGSIQSVGGLVSALSLYVIGRKAKPEHRILILLSGVTLFALGGLFNAVLFNATGVVLFMVCLILARPMNDMACYPIQLRAIEIIASIENRTQYAYILNQEFGYYAGRLAGCGLFILLAFKISDAFALRYALLSIGLMQFLTVYAAKRVAKGCETTNATCG